MNTKLTNLVSARDAHAAAKVDLRTKRNTLTTLMKGGRQYATISREVLKTYLGTELSEEFELAGFVNSLGVPFSIAGLLRVLQGIKTHFTAHPEQENALLNVTAARATTFITDITAALAAVDQAKAALRTLLNQRDAKVLLVRRDLQSLLAELRLKVDSLDPVWEAFGFNRPGAEHIPDVPANVELIPAGPNALSVKWGAAARADHYRVWKKIVGVDEELIPVGSLADLDFLLESLPANATVEVAVSAVNNGGESAKSAVVQITL